MYDISQNYSNIRRNFVMKSHTFKIRNIKIQHLIEKLIQNNGTMAKG